MGKLICCCDKADELVCDQCPKGKRIKPDVKIYHPAWVRKITASDINKQVQSIIEDQDVRK